MSARAEMKNVTVNGLWVSDGDELPVIAVMCINSYLVHGHGFRLWSYTKKFKNLPAGCELADAAEFIAPERVYKDVVNSYGHFSDLWRWTFMLKTGGFWSDLDVCCLSDRIPAVDGFHICSATDDIHGSMVGTLMMPKGHPASAQMLEICEAPYRITEFDQGELLELKREVLRKWSDKKDLLKNAVYSSTYRCFGNVLAKYGIGKDKILPKETVYPVQYENIQRLNLPAWNLSKITTAETRAVHLWGSYYKNSISIFKQIPCALKELYDAYYDPARK